MSIKTQKGLYLYSSRLTHQQTIQKYVLKSHPKEYLDMTQNSFVYLRTAQNQRKTQSFSISISMVALMPCALGFALILADTFNLTANLLPVSVLCHFRPLHQPPSFQAFHLSHSFATLNCFTVPYTTLSCTN